MEGIEKHEGGTTFTGAGIELLRLTTMVRALGLENKGIKMVRHSVYAQAKRELGFKGNREKVYAQLLEHMRTQMKEKGATEADVDALLSASR